MEEIMCNLIMADVGHGLSLACSVQGISNFHVDCGGEDKKGEDKKRERAFSNLRDNNPKFFILSHFHSDHYNALTVPLKGGSPQKLNIKELYFPRIPDMPQREEFLKCLLAMNTFILGGDSGSMEFDLINLFDKINNKSFSTRPLSQGDVIENGIEILWPPKHISEYKNKEKVNKKVQEAIKKFNEAKNKNSKLKEIYEKINDGLINQYLEPQENYNRDSDTHNIGENEKLDKEFDKAEIKEANKALKEAANYFSIAFKIDERMLFMGDLEESNIGKVLSDLKYGSYHILIAPHHGTHWNNKFNNFRFHFTLASLGNKYGFVNLCKFKNISERVCVTCFCGDIEIPCFYKGYRCCMYHM